MKEIINNKCKNCAGELIFDIDSQELKCIQCSSMVDIPEKQALLEKKEYSKCRLFIIICKCVVLVNLKSWLYIQQFPQR